MAVIRARGVAAPLNTAYAAEEFKFYLKDSKSKLLLLPSEGNAAAETAAVNLKLPVVAARFDKSWVEFLPKSACFNIRSSDEAEAIPLDNVGDDVALFLHTSRTTCRPKGVPLTQQNLAASAEHIRDTYQLSVSDVTVITLPLFTDASTSMAEDEDAATAEADAAATATSTVTATAMFMATATSAATAVNVTKTTATSTATATALFTSTATSTASATPPATSTATAITTSTAKPATTTIFHIHGHDHHGLIAALLSSLVSGASVVLPAAARFSASTFWNDMKAHGATWYTAVPTIHQILLDRHNAEPEERYPQLRFIRSCGASLAPVILERLEKAFGAPVLEAYAMTEASHQITSNPLPQYGQRKQGSVGKPTGLEIAIRKEIGAEQPRRSSG